MIAASLSEFPAEARRPDVAIIGAGATGIALAVLLARKGLQVTLVEGGPVQPPVAFRKANRARSTGRKHLGIEEGRMKALGGTTRLWGGQLMPFGPGDLSGNTYSGKPAWPIVDVVKYLQDASGTHLDAHLVRLMIDNLDKALAINAQYPG